MRFRLMSSKGAQKQCHENPTILTIALVLGFLAASMNGSRAQTGKEEAELLKAWSAFQEAPTSENALALYQALPESSGSAIRLNARQSETLRLIYQNLDILDARVGYGDGNSVKVA